MKFRLYHFFWGITLLFLIAVLLSDGESALDIQLTDTYFVISYRYIYVFMALVFAVLGLVFWLLDKTRNKN